MSTEVKESGTSSSLSEHTEPQVMSEKVKLVAGAVYREFEKIIEKCGSDSVQGLMPLVVSILENLEDTFRAKQKQDLEIVLLQEDNKQLLTQYGKEKHLKKELDQRMMQIEDAFEEERSLLNCKVDNLESQLRVAQIASKNQAGTVQRMKEKIDELKSDNDGLQTKLSSTYQSYMELFDKNRFYSQQLALQSRAKIKPPTVCITSGDVSETALVTSKYQTNAQIGSNEGNDFSTDRQSEGLDEDNLSEYELVPPQDFQTDMGDLSVSECTNTADPTGAEDSDSAESMVSHAESGMVKEVTSLMKDYKELVNTKEALNVVKDDLIQQVDTLTTERTVLREDLSACLLRKEELENKNNLIQRQMKDLRKQMEEIRLKHEKDLEEGKRFTKAELSILLRERNEYKEKFLELQDAVVYTEIVRQSRNHPELLPRSKLVDATTSKPSSLLDYFERLLYVTRDEG